MEAYNLYLKGSYALDRDDQTGYEEAVADFQQVLRMDPTFARAAVGLIGALIGQIERGYAPRSTWEDVRAAAQLASRLDPKLAEPHGALALLHLSYDWDWAAVDRETKLALALEPRNPYVIATAAIVSEVFFRLDEAIRYENEAMALDPLEPAFQVQLAAMFIQAQRYDDAEAAYRKAIELAPARKGARNGLGLLYLIRGRPQAALAQFDPNHIDALAMVYHALGRHADSDRMLAQVIAEVSDDAPGAIARIYAFRGEPDAALTWLERAYRQKDDYLLGIRGDPIIQKALGRDPRFQELIRKINFPKY
jgi:tetratricopeptide (TPR) repeat protein